VNHGTPGAMNGILAAVQHSDAAANGQPPEKFLLRQNYPNPFNQTTSIVFQLHDKLQPEKQNLANQNCGLKIFDIKGRLVQTIIHKNGTPSNGCLKFTWQADHDLATGVYFYFIEIDGLRSGIRKMLLLK